ncbi:hypothetical protein CXB51_003145 [Gossypium anomalum]|uniref:Phytosulfokine n=1 Tax=Gossypium anomalum TaxID=47600 RepID=A0A8J5ZPB0_9ROSI|nr:hypothetical protein CXB51_003145 [Gossypium anomalum]
MGLSTFFSLLLVCFSAQRLLPQKPGDEEFKAKAIIQPALSTYTKEDFSDLMGSEDCNEKDEGCVKRRMFAEAHLDYIYTQHHNPKPKP